MKVSRFSRIGVPASLLICAFLTSTVMAQSGTAHKIVYLRHAPSPASLWIMNPDGTSQTQLCNCSNVERPVVSPDGNKVAFEMSGNIWVINTDGSGLFNVTQSRGNYIGYATWGPDSTQLVFEMAIGVQTDVYRVNIDGSNLTKLTTSQFTNSRGEFVASNFYPAWSPDGSKIAFRSNRWKNNVEISGIYVQFLGGGDFKVGNGYLPPVWSPDSSRLVALGGEQSFDCGPSGKAGLYLMSLSGRRPIRITDCNAHNGPNYAAAWSPNGKKLAYQLGGKVYTMNPDGSSKTVVGLHASTYNSPSWSTDGKKIFYGYDNYPAEIYNEIYSVNADGTGPTNLTNTSAITEFEPVTARGTACDQSTITPPPTQTVSSPWAYDLDDVNPNWTMTVEVSAGDGLVVKDVRLGNRYLAQKISVPYYTLETNTFGRQRGKLKPNSSDASMRSRLVDYSVDKDDEKLVIEGTYAVDQIGQSCLQVTQRYEFYRQGVGGPCEPTGMLPCARWKPNIYYLFSGRGGETISAINFAQRQHLTIDNKPRNTVGLFKDCDLPPIPPLFLPCGVSLGTSPEGLVAFERKENPLFHEMYGRAVQEGKNARQWDNIHQTPLPIVFEPSLMMPGVGGCPECSHSHWRWASFLPGAFLNGRILGIPEGSKQDLEFAVVLYRSGEENPNDFKELVGGEPIRTHDVLNREWYEMYYPSIPQETVLWYSATSHENSDTFLGHGGFFNPVINSILLYPGYTNGPTQEGVSSIVTSQIYEPSSANIVPFDPATAGSLPAGYTQYGTHSYEITATGEVSGPHTITFSVPSVTDQNVFNNLRVFHLEVDPYDPEATVWVDRTVLAPDPQGPDFTNKTINAKAALLGDFVVASLTDPQPPNTNVADLAISINHSQDPIVVGNNLTYTLGVTNNGPQPATQVRLSYALSPYADFISATSNDGTCKYSDGSVVCKLTPRSVAEVGTVTITIRTTSNGIIVPAQGQVINSIAHVIAEETDPNSANNTVTSATTILPDPNIAPTISITSPSNDYVVVGPSTITINASASDQDGSISSVEFFDNGQSIGLGNNSGPNEYTLSWTNVAFGNHSLIAVATDNAGKSVVSDASNILINGLANVRIFTPSDEAAFTSPANINFQATAWYSSGNSSITKVEFYANGHLIGTGTYDGTFYNVTWSNVYSGSYLVTAVATDDADIVTVSSPVRVYVDVRINQSPIANITSPTAGTMFTTPANVAITASATDSDGTVTGVEFYADGALIGAGSVSGPNQYSLTWSNAPIGNHTLNVVARDDDGAPTSSADVTIQVVSSALLVAGSATLNSSDAALKTRLEALNYTVTVKDAATATTADANGKAVVVISSTVNPSSVGTKFRTVAVPVVTWESGLFANLGMTGSTNKDSGTATRQTQITITNPAHPMASGLSGTVAVVTVSGTLDWGKPNANAASVATVVGDPSKTVIFGYVQGAAMPGLTAPARRVGLFMHDTSAASFTTNGGLLFDAAIKWATGRI